MKKQLFLIVVGLVICITGTGAFYAVGPIYINNSYNFALIIFTFVLIFTIGIMIGHYFSNRRCFILIKKHKRDVSFDAMRKIDEMRSTVFHQISGNVAHDMAGMLHVISFCIDELENYVEDSGRKFLERLQSCTDTLSQSVESFRRDGAKNSSLNKVGQNIFLNAHQEALKLVKTEYWNSYKLINFNLSDSVKTAIISMSKKDVVHILYNIYCFLMRNLKDFKGARFNISLQEMDFNQSIISIAVTPANGSVIISKQFVGQLNEDNLFFKNNDKLSRIQLALRILKKNGGSLDFDLSSSPGVTIKVRLPIKYKNIIDNNKTFGDMHISN